MNENKCMKKIYYGLLLLAVMAASCHNGSGNITNKCGPCPLYDVMQLMVVKVKIVDKATGADLLLVPNAPYKLSDLHVSSSVTDNRYIIDTVSSSKPAIWLPDAQSQTYTLQLASLSADHIKVVAGLNDQKCCAVTEVKSITLNDSLVCAPCSAQQDVVIKK
jgi:hypothetical protein